MQKNSGKVIIPSGRLPWAHELRVANILASNGYNVEFLPERSIKTADILLDGIEFEIKSPITNKWDKLERNLKRATKQSCNVVFDATRVKGLSDVVLAKFLSERFRRQKQLRKLLFITKAGQIIDISHFS